MQPKKEKAYVVTRDLVPTLRNRLHLPISEGMAAQIVSLEQEFLQGFWPFVDEQFSRFELRCEEIAHQTEQLLLDEGRPVISLDDVYFTQGVHSYLHLTRLTDPLDQTGHTVAGARPGHPTLEEQIGILQRILPNKHVALVDVGAFSGESLRDTIEFINQTGMKVDVVYLSLAGSDSKDVIGQVVPRSNIVIMNEFNFGEWIELRDFFSIDGRNVNHSDAYYSRNGKIIIPYKEGPLSSWASILGPQREEFRQYCSMYFGKLQSILRTEGVEIDLIPFSLNGTSNVYSLKTGVQQHSYKPSKVE